MKPATVAPQSGETVEVIKRTRVLPGSQPENEADYWTYVAALGPADWPRHLLYLARIEPQPPITLMKSGDGFFTLPGGQRVSAADPDELELLLSQVYGGGTYRILLKKGAQLIKRTIFPIGAPPRAITIPALESANNGANVTVSPDGMTAIATKAIDTVAGQESHALGIAVNALGATAQMVQQLAKAGPNNGGDDLLRQLLVAKLNENPMTQMIQMLTLMKELNAISGGGAGMPSGMMEKIFGAMFDRFVNPAPAQAPINATAEAIRQAPQFLAHLAELAREQRMAAEAQARIATAPRGPVAVVPQAQPVLPAAPAPAANASGGPTVDFVEKKIVEIFTRPISAEAAADEVMSFIQELDQNALANLARLGEEGLLQMFGTRPILKQCTGNMPRLVEFIKAFLRMYAEDEAKVREQNVPPAN